MKIGILSGTFDPIHQGHLEIAQAAAQQHGIEQVLFLVEKSPRHKDDITPYEHRVKMLELALSGNTNVSIWHAREPAHNHQTLVDIVRQHPKSQFFLLMGSDVAQNLDKWQAIRRIQKLSKILIVGRHPDTDGDIALNFPVSSSKIRQDLKEGKAVKGVPWRVLRYIKEHGLYR